MCAYALRRWRPSLYAIAAATTVAGGWAVIGPPSDGNSKDSSDVR